LSILSGKIRLGIGLGQNVAVWDIEIFTGKPLLLGEFPADTLELRQKEMTAIGMLASRRK
jgi:hypothetical protein